MTGRHRKPDHRPKIATLAVVIVAALIWMVTPHGSTTVAEPGILDPLEAVRAQCEGEAMRSPGDASYLQWLQHCARAMRTGDPSASVIPTQTSSSPTVTPSTVVTTSASPTVSPTTAVPSPSPSSSPTITITPSGPVQSWPTPATTGVPPGTVLSDRGNLTITQPGTYDRLNISGCVDIQANNVTISRSRIIGTNCPFYVVRSFNRSGVWVVDSEINMAGHLGTKGIAFDGYTLTRVYEHNGSDCAHMGLNVTIIDSYCKLGPDGNSAAFCNGPDHFDGYQTDGGRHILLIHNRILNPCAQTSAILIDSDLGPTTDVHILRNFVAGGGYSIYCNARDVSPSPTVEFKDNVVSRQYYPRGGFWGPVTSCPVGTGNRYEDGKPL